MPRWTATVRQGTKDEIKAQCNYYSEYDDGLYAGSGSLEALEEFLTENSTRPVFYVYRTDDKFFGHDRYQGVTEYVYRPVRGE